MIIKSNRKGMDLSGVASCTLPWFLIQNNMPRRSQWSEGPFFPNNHIFTVPFSHRSCCHLLWADVPVPHNLSFAFCQTSRGQLWFSGSCSLRNPHDLSDLSLPPAPPALKDNCQDPRMLILMQIPLAARDLLIWHYFHLCDRQPGLVLQVFFVCISFLDSHPPSVLFWTEFIPLALYIQSI